MGDYLRAARRRRRVSIERAAEETRIRADFLMRMESDEFDFMAVAYVRGFLRNYARYLQIDPEPLIEEFDRRFGTGPAATTMVDLSGRRRPAKEPRPIPRWLVAALSIIGVLALFALIGLAVGGEGANDDTAEPIASLPPSETPSPKKTPKEKKTPTPKPTPTRQQARFPEGFSVEIVAVYERSWIDVDADGKDVFAQTLEQGESETFEADETMEITFGFPNGIEMILHDIASGREYHLGTPGGGVNPNVVRLPDDFNQLRSA